MVDSISQFNILRNRGLVLALIALLLISVGPALAGGFVENYSNKIVSVRNPIPVVHLSTGQNTSAYSDINQWKVSSGGNWDVWLGGSGPYTYSGTYWHDMSSDIAYVSCYNFNHSDPGHSDVWCQRNY